MKKIFFYIIGASVALAACQKKSDGLIQNQTVDDRLNAAMLKYQNILMSAPNGWKVFEKSGIAFNNGAYDSAKATFVYYMQFKDSNNVKMYGSFDTTQAKVPKSSGYRLKALQRPTLLFDTYSYIHVPCDPDPNISKSPLDPGSGWGTDFEFMIVDNVAPDQLGDTIHLVGLKNNATAFMVRATQAEKAILDNGQYATNLNAISTKFLTYWQRFTVGTTTYELPNIDFTGKNITINWLDAGGNLQSFSSQFWVDFDGSLVFEQPLVNGTIVIKSFTPALKLIGTNLPDNIVITPAIAPLKLDLTAAQNWYTQMNVNFNGCWVSDKAFHLNGVDDACQFGNVTSAGATAVTKGTAQLWFAGEGLFGTNPYDGFITLVNYSSLPSPYFASDRPITINGGIATFSYYGAAGTFSGAAGTLAYSMSTARTIIFYTSSGTRTVGYWYLIPTSSTGKNYDMVRVSDALAWISWRPR